MTDVDRWIRTNDLAFHTAPLPMLWFDAQNAVLDANAAAEQFWGISLAVMQAVGLFDGQRYQARLAAILAQARQHLNSVRDLNFPLRMLNHSECVVDLYAAPDMSDAAENSNAYAEKVLLIVQPHSVAEDIDQRLTLRQDTRSMGAMAATLAHELRNPLAGIGGAAQLLQMSESQAENQELSALILAETDRIKRLIDRFELFSEQGVMQSTPVNIHDVLQQARQIAQAGFGADVTFVEHYDPSLPLTVGDRDRLLQVFLNLLKNAAEAIAQTGQATTGSCITLTTAYRSGIRLRRTDGTARAALPLEIQVQDTGGGIPESLGHAVFDPFVSTKTDGTGLGLAVVAKIIADHEGVVDIRSTALGACFRILLPIWTAD